MQGTPASRVQICSPQKAEPAGGTTPGHRGTEVHPGKAPRALYLGTKRTRASSKTDVGELSTKIQGSDAPRAKMTRLWLCTGTGRKGWPVYPRQGLLHWQLRPGSWTGQVVLTSHMPDSESRSLTSLSGHTRPAGWTQATGAHPWSPKKPRGGHAAAPLMPSALLLKPTAQGPGWLSGLQPASIEGQFRSSPFLSQQLLPTGDAVSP